MSARRARPWWIALAIVAFGMGVLAAIQSIGYWVVTAVTGAPATVLFIDHAGPAVMSGLIAIVALGLGSLALVAARRRPDAA